MQSLIIKVWGKSVGYNFLLKKLHNIWKPNAFMDLVALENEYFLVKFYSKADYTFARGEGPWTILDHYLVVKEWTPNFDHVIDKTEKLIVWVRFPCFPIEYFDFAFLKNVGEKIGKPIRADQNTETSLEGRFTRLCIEVDITKPLLAKFKLSNRIRTIEYKGIHLVCFGYGVYRHIQYTCPKNAGITKENLKEQEELPEKGCMAEGRGELAVNGEVTIVSQIRKEINRDVECSGSFGPWILAKKPKTRYRRSRIGKNQGGGDYTVKENYHVRNESNSRKKQVGGEKVEVNSRFNALYGLEDIEEEHQNETNHGLIILEQIRENTKDKNVAQRGKAKNKKVQAQKSDIIRGCQTLRGT